MPLPRIKRSHGRKQRSKKKQDFIITDELEKQIIDKKLDFKGIYHLLRTTTKFTFKNLLLRMMQEDNNEQQFQPFTKSVILAFLARYFWKRVLKEEESILIVTPYTSKGIEYVNLPSILNRKILRKIISTPNKTIPFARIVYKYNPPISLALCNYSKELKNLNQSDLEGMMKMNCDCKNSRFNYNPLGHVVTGNLDIIENKKLQLLFQKGTKYREPKPIDWTEVKTTAQTVSNNYINKIGKKFKLPVNIIHEWNTKCSEIIDAKIKSSSKMYDYTKSAMTDFRVRQELRNLQKKYIIVPVDKAPNNYSFICKKFYMIIMCKELGISFDMNGIKVQGNDTYNKDSRDINQIIHAHEKLANAFRIQLDKDDKCIPILHAIPKMHKVPYKFRFIAGARNSSMKNISKLVQRALIFLRRHFRNYCQIAKSRGNIGCYWATDGSIQTVNDMKSIRVQNNTTIFTADFASLFTNLPHDLVLSKVMGLVGKCFANSGGKLGLVFTYENVYYADTNPNKNGSVFYHKVEIIEMIDQVLKQGYVKFGNIVFHQKCGVPMGGNASPMLADLTLSMIEFEYLSKQQNLNIARTFGKVYRYMDDIAVIGEGDFKQVFNQIYPDSLQLEETSTSEKESNFLDLTISIEPNNTILTKLYNKTDDYTFRVVRYPHYCSNMHIDVAIRCYHAEILRFTRLCSKLYDFSQRLRYMELGIIKVKNKK